ncbi:MAG: hypothetical protein KJ749_15695, partial [Planctomycetes bacterium]|nr:hypothetical protein [Planctomycetota bacterium]
EEWSHPGVLLHEWRVGRLDTREHPIGCDFHPEQTLDTCFRYDFQIPRDEWFYQPNRPTIFWVSISAVYEGEPSPHLWGWKTREYMFQDAAVRISAPTDPVRGDRFVEGAPIEEPDRVPWDMAFVITTKVDMDNLLETYPPHCAIDARQPHGLDDPLVRFGWNSLRLVFEFDPTSMGLVPGDFTVATYSNGTPATPPGISAVITNGPAHAVTIMLDQMIEPRNWTCLTHTDSGNHWCMGYLPADVNQDGLSATQDINKLIDCLNLVAFPPCGMWQTDIDRSGLPRPQDILREIDLLNGAMPFEVWITENLPDCP